MKKQTMSNAKTGKRPTLASGTVDRKKDAVIAVTRIETPLSPMLAILAAVSIFCAAGSAHAAAVSANGFNCTQQQTPDKRSLVECIGQFQGVVGIFAATGYDIVHVEYSPDNKKRYFYMSETGCLILNAGDNTALATDKSGVKKQFPAFMDAMSWCYTGGQPAPGAKQSPPTAPVPK